MPSHCRAHDLEPVATLAQGPPRAVDWRATRIVTDRCLIGMDVDDTVLSHDQDAAAEFFRTVASHIVQTACLGMHVAFLTANSVDQMAERLLPLLVEELCHRHSLESLGQFHFVCNGGGAYARFPISDPEHPELGDLLNHPYDHGQPTRVLERLRCRELSGLWTLRPAFISSTYVDRCQIEPKPELRSETERTVTEILGDEAGAYVTEIEHDPELATTYDLTQVSDQNGLMHPQVELRSIDHGPARATVQMTIKPIASHCITHAGQPREAAAIDDPRARVTAAIQRKLDAAGLGHLLIARPGGRTSIDITRRSVDKATALKEIITRLQTDGTQALFFGDEIVADGGNDWPVTDIPGLTIFAVNDIDHPAPFLPSVLVPSALLTGPHATAKVLQQLNEIAVEQIKAVSNGSPSDRTAVDLLKQDIYATRVEQKLRDLLAAEISSDDWQTIHAFMTLVSRPDPQSRGYVTVVRDHLDSLLKNCQPKKCDHIFAAGTSHPDWTRAARLSEGLLGTRARTARTVEPVSSTNTSRIDEHNSKESETIGGRLRQRTAWSMCELRARVGSCLRTWQRRASPKIP